jgi:hypothetical protein
MLSASSTLSTILTTLTSPMLMMFLILLTSLLVLACLVMGAGLLDSPHAQHHRPPNLKDSAPPWIDWSTPLFYYDRDPKLPLLVTTLLYQEAVPPLPLPPHPPSMNPLSYTAANGRPVPFILDPTSHPLIEALEFIMWWRQENPDAGPTDDARLMCLRSSAATMRQHPMYSRDTFIRSVQDHINHWKWEVERSHHLVRHK